ncbi:MAG: ABC transporter permease subunit [Bacteroidales bacterium]|nr:ABC transporter permease subunit [Bacteroidales bacterium]
MKRIYLLLIIALCLVACNKQTKQKPAEEEITSIEDLKGKVVGTLTGSSFEIDFAGRKDFQVVRQPSLSDLIASLRKGRIDAILYDEDCFPDTVLRQNGIKLAFVTEENYPCAFACRKSEQDLVNKFNEFLARIKSSGELATITEKWRSATDYTSITMPETSDSLPGEPLVVGTSYSTAPISYMIGDKWYGFEIEILNLFGEYIGRPVQYRLFDLAALVPALKAGKIDMAGGLLFKTEERQKKLALTDVYFYNRGGFFVRDLSQKTPGGTPGISDIKGSVENNLLVENRWVFLARGLKVTLEITLLSMLFGGILGSGLLSMRRSKRRWAKMTAMTYASFFRGIPMVVLLMILAYIVMVGASGVSVAVVAFTLVFASSFATTMDNAIQAVGVQQYEAGEAMGFTRVQIFRYITGPQALQRALPQFKGEAVALIKNTSVVGYVAIQDLTRACDMIRARTFEAVFPILFITVIYFFLSWIMGKFLDYIFKIAIKLYL